MFDFLKKPEEDVTLEIPGVLIKFNHRLKIALMYIEDPRILPESLLALEAHLNQQHYHLQVFLPPLAPPPKNVSSEGA